MNKNWFYKHTKIISGGVITAGLCVALLLFYTSEKSHDQIVSYNAAKHERPIIDFFKTDYYWLVGYPNFSPEFMLHYRASHQNVSYAGLLEIKVLELDNQFVGFTAYHLDGPGIGRVLFLAVKDAFRGKRYGEKLLTSAIKGLKAMGAKKARLAVRTENISAQKLYKRVGFYEAKNEGPFLTYEYDL